MPIIGGIYYPEIEAEDITAPLLQVMRLQQTQANLALAQQRLLQQQEQLEFQRTQRRLEMLFDAIANAGNNPEIIRPLEEEIFQLTGIRYNIADRQQEFNKRYKALEKLQRTNPQLAYEMSQRLLVEYMGDEQKRQVLEIIRETLQEQIKKLQTAEVGAAMAALADPELSPEERLPLLTRLAGLGETEAIMQFLEMWREAEREERREYPLPQRIDDLRQEYNIAIRNLETKHGVRDAWGRFTLPADPARREAYFRELRALNERYRRRYKELTGEEPPILYGVEEPDEIIQLEEALRLYPDRESALRAMQRIRSQLEEAGLTWEQVIKSIDKIFPVRAPARSPERPVTPEVPRRVPTPTPELGGL